MRICRHCVVSGRVQGVFYRQGTFNKANELGIKGWVRNLPTGEVECLICGEEEAVDKLIAWLNQGPVAAKVKELKVQSWAWEDHEKFLIRHEN